MPSQPLTVFISYARKDKAHKTRLLKHLKGLVRRGVISIWDDGMLVPGCEWNAEIIARFDAARIILLLISPDFLDSDYVNEFELPRAAARHARGEARVIPVLVRSYGWKKTAFGKGTLNALQVLPADRKFISELKDKDAAYRDVAEGIERTAAELADADPPEKRKEEVTPDVPPSPDARRGRIPDAPTSGVMQRRDEEGRYIISHLVKELAPGRNRHVVLSGPGGVGKTTLAAEAARRLMEPYGGRVVWSDASRREHYTLSSLFEDVILKLGEPQAQPRPGDDNREAAVGLLSAGPALIVIDSYESAEAAERREIERWFRDEAPCRALFVSQTRVPRLDPHNVFVPAHMRREEETKMLDLLKKEVKNKDIFTKEVCERIYEESDGNPLAMKLIVAQLDVKTRAEGVFEELMLGKGEAADRAFNRAFEHQLEPDGRAALLALSLFTPSATHEALARVAGFTPAPKPGGGGAGARRGAQPTDEATRRGLRRLDRAVASLNLLSLLKVEGGGCRLGLENLTRTLAVAALTKAAGASGFKRRFVEYFREHARRFRWAECQAPSAVETERSNVVAAMKFATELKDWDTVLELFAVTLHHVNTYAVWKRSVVAAEREAADRLSKKNRTAPLLIEINHRHENKRETRGHYEGIPAKLGMACAASHADLFRPGWPDTDLELEEPRKLVVLSVAAFELGVCAYYRAAYQRAQGELAAAKKLSTRARGYFKAAKKLKLSFNDKGGYGIACNNLAVTLGVEGRAKQGMKGWKAKALKEAGEALKHFMQQQKDSSRFEKFEKVARLNIEWLESLEE